MRLPPRPQQPIHVHIGPKPPQTRRVHFLVVPRGGRLLFGSTIYERRPDDPMWEEPKMTGHRFRHRGEANPSDKISRTKFR